MLNGSTYLSRRKALKTGAAGLLAAAGLSAVPSAVASDLPEDPNYGEGRTLTTSRGPNYGGGSDHVDEDDDAGFTIDDADYVVESATELEDALAAADYGEVVFVPGDAEIDTGARVYIDIPDGVTLASDRGVDGSDGGLIYTDTIRDSWPRDPYMLQPHNDVRVSGIRVRGKYWDWGQVHRYSGGSGRQTISYVLDLPEGTSVMRWENVGKNDDSTNYKMALYSLSLEGASLSQITYDTSELFTEASTDVDDSFDEAIQLEAEQEGEWWEFEFDVPETGEYTLDIEALFGPSTYGIYELYVDGEHIDTIDFMDVMDDGDEAPHDGYLTGYGISAVGTNVEVDNCELYGFAGGAVSGDGLHVHHCDIHDTLGAGLGYGVSTTNAEIHHNTFNRNRHAVASSGSPGSTYDVHHNVIGDYTMSHVFDVHDPGGERFNIHHNTVRATHQYNEIRGSGDTVPAVTIRGVPEDKAWIQNNWFHNPVEPRESPHTSLWTGEAITQVLFEGDYDVPLDEWANVEFQRNHYGTDSDPDGGIGAPHSDKVSF